MKKFTYFATILVLVVLGIYFISNNSANGPLPGEPSLGENIITYTSSGFSPVTLAVKKGTEITFFNKSDGAMWPASAVHPTHTLYPTSGGCIGSTFDACEGIASGGVWRFTFDQVGTWKYHNHLNPSQTGTIVVE